MAEGSHIAFEQRLCGRVVQIDAVRIGHHQLHPAKGVLGAGPLAVTPVLHDITPAGGFGGSGSHSLADAFGDDAFRYLPPGGEGYAGDLSRKYWRWRFRTV